MSDPRNPAALWTSSPVNGRAAVINAGGRLPPQLVRKAVVRLGLVQRFAEGSKKNGKN